MALNPHNNLVAENWLGEQDGHCMAGYWYRQQCVQPHLVVALCRFVAYGEVPGDFLQAVLRSDLVDACQRADYINIANLPAFAAWLANEAPAGCWGSASKVAQWAERGGLFGETVNGG